MEGSSQLHAEENKALPETNKKRRFKTAFQLQALEEFYNEQKYPTETEKVELAEKLGLTEKQISGWFCHRRLKDRRLQTEEGNATGRQDLSSGVIQDHGSGLRQDSCGSTKQGEYRMTDLREVESQRLYNEDLQLSDLRYEQRRQYCDVSGMDVTSSESNSALQDGFPHRTRDDVEIESPPYVIPSGGFVPESSRGRVGPSGYLKIRGQAENSAITAVKRQLGRHFQVDGPPLGVDFDPLPPGAFESPSKNTMHEPYRCTERIPVSLDVRGSCRPPNPRSDLYFDAVKQMSQGAEQDIHMPHHRKPKKLSHGSAQFALKASGIDEYSAEEPPIYDGNVNRDIRKHDSKVTKPESFSSHNHGHPSHGKINVEEGEHWQDDFDEATVMPARKRSGLKPMNSSLRPSYKDSLDEEEILLSSRIPEAGNPFVERGKIKERPNLLRAKNLLTESKARYKDRGHFGQGYAARPSSQDSPQPQRPSGRSVVEIPSSFSEDETAGTSSSAE